MASSMAIKHRKLFPTSTTNETLVCPDVCDPICPYGCNPGPEPDFYFLPPPPPPSLLANQGHHVSPYVIIIVTLLASLFLMVSYYVIIMKHCRGWNPFRRPEPDEEFLDENRGPAIEHPIWYITTVGLQPSVINSITVFKYKKGDSLVEGTDCSVCLNEFQDDETLRLLPKCNHAFHIPCIDTWLRSHTNCPLCRAGIVSNTVSTTPLVPNNQNSNSLSLNEETQIENSESDGELHGNQVTVVEFCENRAGTEDEIEFSQVGDETKDIENPKADFNSNGNTSIWATGDSGDNSMIVGDEIQAMRRSISLDSVTAANIGLVVTTTGMADSEENSVDSRLDIQKFETASRDGRNSRMFRLMAGSGSSFVESLHKSPVSMKRSFSYSGRPFLLRHSRSFKPILPL
ncbi:unnamed protein product [Ilex paraguariensis]|uniref:RING-type E3 ubiquitin transferase n=1 Tax=Ilex paraguariensis TaxID=185542 RepID=A0ABC8RVL7_9AQUA